MNGLFRYTQSACQPFEKDSETLLPRYLQLIAQTPCVTQYYNENSPHNSHPVSPNADDHYSGTTSLVAVSVVQSVATTVPFGRIT